MAQMVNQRDKSVSSLLKLWDGHKFSSGSVARDVLLFCVDPHAYSFDATRLTQLDLGLRVAALNVMQHTPRDLPPTCCGCLSLNGKCHPKINPDLPLSLGAATGFDF